MQYKISPSSLTFLYEECKRCFWLSAHKRWSRPFTPFPSVFNRIDKAMRSFYHDRLIHEVVASLPEGAIDTSERKLLSRPLDVQVGDRAATVQFSGKMDCLVKFADGTVGVIDFKTSEAREQHLSLYTRQLHAYAAILQHPEKGAPQRVSQMGLIAVTPDHMRLDEGGDAVFGMRVLWQPLAIDPDWWESFLVEVVGLLEDPEPAGTHNCPYCAMQRAIASQELAASTLSLPGNPSGV